MSKSKKSKMLSDDTGRKYTFNRLAFADAILSMHKSLREDGTTIGQILEEIANECSVSVDAVKKWRSGANGIGNIETAALIARVLKIDRDDILTPVHDIQEVKKMSIDVKSVVEIVFGDCVSVIYKIDEIEKLPSVQKRKDKPQNQREVDAMLRSAHRYVDQQLLLTGLETHYRLHRILLELGGYASRKFDFVSGCGAAERWEDISNTISTPEYDFVGDTSREAGLKSEDYDFKRLYLMDEISLAEELGFECVQPPDENRTTLKGDCTGFGFVAEDGMELSPSIIGLDLMVNMLRDVFRADFPEVYDQ